MKYCWILFILPVWLFFASLGTDDAEAKAAVKVKNYFQDQFLFFRDKVRDLQSAEAAGKEEALLRPGFLACREAFKRTEFLLSYVESNETKKFNGANLVTNEYDSVAPKEEVRPHGLQVIEDLIYNPSESSREELHTEISLLEALAGKFIDRNNLLIKADIKDLNLVTWDAMRYEIFRIESMGITGFDVPDSENSVPESREALRSLLKVVSFYKQVFKQRHIYGNYKVGTSAFRAAIKYLETNGRFDELDRLCFMRDYLHPLSAWLAENAALLGFTYPVNVRMVRTEAKHLFADDFFNPAYFSPNSNAVKVALGKRLFADPVLSLNGARSCTSCHDPGKAFTDGLVKNLVIDGQGSLLRNTPSLWNAGVQTRQFYDSRVKNLEKQSLSVIHNQQEMGGDLKRSVEKLKSDPAYVSLFAEAYGGNLNEFNIVNAISCYIRSLVSFNARFDKYLRGENAALNESEKRGFNLFAGKAKCATCHFMPLFNGLVPPRYTETESEILGVPERADIPSGIDSDEGKFTYTRLALHRYAFKTSGLRNVELTAPYMHNGVFSTLEEVIDFYDHGGGSGQGMKLENQTLSADSLHLSPDEKKDIVAFLKSLTE